MGERSAESVMTLTRETEMSLRGGARSEVDEVFRGYLRANPDVAAELGMIIESVGESLRQAFPGQVRVDSFTNEEWREAGYSHVAELNELLHLKVK